MTARPNRQVVFGKDPFTSTPTTAPTSDDVVGCEPPSCGAGWLRLSLGHAHVLLLLQTPRACPASARRSRTCSSEPPHSARRCSLAVACGACLTQPPTQPRQPAGQCWLQQQGLRGGQEVARERADPRPRGDARLSGLRGPGADPGLPQHALPPRGGCAPPAATPCCTCSVALVPCLAFKQHGRLLSRLPGRLLARRGPCCKQSGPCCKQSDAYSGPTACGGLQQGCRKEDQHPADQGSACAGPAITHFQQVEAKGGIFWLPLLLAIGIAEGYRVAVGWKPPTSEAFYTLYVRSLPPSPAQPLAAVLFLGLASATCSQLQPGITEGACEDVPHQRGLLHPLYAALSLSFLQQQLHQQDLAGWVRAGCHSQPPWTPAASLRP